MSNKEDVTNINGDISNGHIQVMIFRIQIL